jgi:hypothetical protein
MTSKMGAPLAAREAGGAVVPPRAVPITRAQERARKVGRSTVPAD